MRKITDWCIVITLIMWGLGVIESLTTNKTTYTLPFIMIMTGVMLIVASINYYKSK